MSLCGTGAGADGGWSPRIASWRPPAASPVAFCLALDDNRVPAFDTQSRQELPDPVFHRFAEEVALIELLDAGRVLLRSGVRQIPKDGRKAQFGKDEPTRLSPTP